MQILVLFMYLGSEKTLEGKLGEPVRWMNSGRWQMIFNADECESICTEGKKFELHLSFSVLWSDFKSLEDIWAMFLTSGLKIFGSLSSKSQKKE